MALLLAPYNNAMRLGQGFNSYTQQICLNEAVLPPSRVFRGLPALAAATVPAALAQEGAAVDGTVAHPGAAAPPDVGPPAETYVANRLDRSHNGTAVNQPLKEGQSVSQIVSYSSRFVEKLSDVTDAMNISASLSIKTATVGGKASGQFIDSDKFKESDLNFFVQVKVVNQVILGEDYTEFQKLNISKQKFTEVYGDTFISGFEEGGELNALLSVKVLDKNKTFAVKAELEATLGTPALSGEVKGGVELEKSDIKSSTETTITVNWSGGGQIKPPDSIWDVNSLTLAATNFADNVAHTPQKTYAILSKYTTLKSFFAHYGSESVLAYENAGVYTTMLLDMYMDYKSIWKQIQLANYELKNRRADMEEAKPSTTILNLAKQNYTELAPVLDGALPASTAGSEATTTSPKTYLPTTINFSPYPATVMGMDKARRDCRNEMIRIVDEVDKITEDPKLALDSERETRFVSPRIFTQLLPVVVLRPIEGDEADTAMPQNPIILGETDNPPKPRQMLYNRIGNVASPQPYPAMMSSILQHKMKSKTFSMGDTWSGSPSPESTTLFFNDLDLVDESFDPTAIAIWILEELVIGIKTVYSGNKEIANGACQGAPTMTLDLRQQGAPVVVQVILEAVQSGTDVSRVRSIGVLDNAGKSSEYPALGRSVPSHSEVQQRRLSPPATGLWSFRGFWGSVIPNQNGFAALGVVWCRDKPERRSIATTGSTTATSGSTAVDSRLYDVTYSLPIEVINTMQKSQDRVGMYYISSNIRNEDLEASSEPKYFNDMEMVKDNVRIKSLIFYYASKKYITGYAIAYTNDQVIQRGEIGVASNGGSDGGWVPHGDHQGIVKIRIADKWHLGLEQNTVRRVVLYDTDDWEAWHHVDPDYQDFSETTLQAAKGWYLKGFWGYTGPRAIIRLGAVWGKLC